MPESRHKSFIKWIFCTISVAIAAILANFCPFCEIFGQFCSKYCNSSTTLNEAFLDVANKPKYFLYDGINRSDILEAVERVLNRLGLEKIDTSKFNLSNFPQYWNLLWTFKHPETIDEYINWTGIEYHQKINHFPGCYSLVDKSFLTTQNDFDFIPKGFLTSEEVQKYAAKHPEKRFVMKLKSNRGVKLVKPSDMNFTVPKTHSDYFAQEYLENPLLWNGYKFDFSIFVVITSVNPLRVYYYNKNVNLRFCLKPYNTANFSDVDSYVIGTNHTSGQNFPYVKKYINAGYTYRDAFEEFIREIGGNVEEIWEKVENLIRNVVLTKEKIYIQSITDKHVSKYNFFELYRFDMIYDKYLNLHLIEVNMSPNLLASSDRSHNNFMFENVIYNLFNMIGIGSSYNKEEFKFSNYGVESMVVYHDALTVKPQICLKPPCDEDCNDVRCTFCWKCLHANKKYEMILAYNEQMNRGHYKRLFPVEEEKIDTKLWKNVTELNKFYVEWFKEMCKKNEDFC